MNENSHDKNGTILPIIILIALTLTIDAVPVACAFVQTEFVWAIITTSMKPFIAKAMALRKIRNTLSNNFGLCVWAIINALSGWAVLIYVFPFAVACSVIANAILAAMICVLRVENINVYKYQRIVAVSLVTSESMPPKLACASTESTQAVAIAIFWAFFSWHEVDVLIKHKFSCCLWERRVNTCIEARVKCLIELFSPSISSNIINRQLQICAAI